MSHRLCPRCHAELLSEDNGAITFCAHCGAPQVMLSEELREQWAQQLAQPDPDQPLSTTDTHSAPAIVTPPPVADPTAVVWSRALQLAALSGVFFAALMLLASALSPVILVALLWLFGAPIILLGIYSAKHPATRITTGFGARLGMLSGLSIGTIAVFVYVLILLTTRFLLHQGVLIDAMFSPSPDQLRAALSRFVTDAALVQQIAQQSIQINEMPEFRVGSLLFWSALLILFYAFYSTLAGAFSGALRSRAATRAATH